MRLCWGWGCGICYGCFFVAMVSDLTGREIDTVDGVGSWGTSVCCCCCWPLEGLEGVLSLARRSLVSVVGGGGGGGGGWGGGKHPRWDFERGFEPVDGRFVSFRASGAGSCHHFGVGW